ncbi:cell division protein FtsZ [Weeksella virosa]|uniref:Cell division protein FtsZ n=1 Tax=Weeksella virosa (strain ATCC 43766 / DSM 16922 / JCM 21250 / CCUG 30538 / CDC 9751 / IAM 14551 / NBRC 16016 / NCTC 11634 / CL345/78) TaxID=865938 RepID=F0P048_WEEVC|nr:cell division protein FtsZ [Weeksella virosa]ADX67395.1 cell division protein FtsZ [Weeksella virosa DSM 16922]VEH62864.1 Cell division protein FtsZ [Weeksella virosa]
MSDITEGLVKFDLPKHRSSAIKVIGVGGGGSNAVNYMFEQGITGVDFVVCNTDAQALENSSIPIRIQLGEAITEGLGAGANPEVGEQAALESMDQIKTVLDSNTKMAFITAGMGGGTGTGAAPVIAGIAKELGILTVGIVTAPFYFEGKMRLEQAELGIEKLRGNVDSLIVINNDKLRELYGNLGYKSGFAKADEVLTTAAKGIAEVITHNYSINIDLRDAKTVLADSGTAIMGSAKAKGENKAKEAIQAALDSPLLNNNRITGAKNVLLLLLSGDNELTMDEIGIINDYIQNEAGHSANIIMGIGEDPSLGEEISITIVATGFPKDDQVYTGKEEEKIIHALEEDQPITKTLAIDQPLTPKVNPINFELNFGTRSEEKDEFIQHDQDTFQEPIKDKESDDEGITKYVLDEESTYKSEETKHFDEYEPRLKSEINNENSTQNQTGSSYQNIGSSNPDQPKNSFVQNPSKPIVEKQETVIFSLNQDKKTSMAAQDVETMKEEIIETPIVDFQKPISEALNSTIEERRNRLKQFNFKFKNTLNNAQVDEFESIPAYKRQGLNLSEREENKPSDFMIGPDSKIKPNNFLHDNVD